MKKRLLTVLLAVCLVLALGTVSALADDAVVAQIGDTTYDTLSSAFANAVDGSEIVLLRDVTGCGRLSLTDGRSIVVNLNGHNIGFAANGYFYVHHGSLTLTGTGEVKEELPYYAPVLVEGAETDLGNNYAVVSVGENVTLEGWSGVFIDYAGTSSGKNHSYGVNVTVNGTINSVLDTSNAAGHGVYINGTIQDIEGSVPVIALGETSSITSQGNGIYAAGYAIWTLAGDVMAPNALSIKSGTFTINSGNYTSTGEFADPATPNGNGSEDTGAALSITSNKAYAGKTDVTVNGGTFVSENGHAVYEGIAYSSTSGAAAEASYASIQINNGVFEAAEGKDAVSIKEAENKKVISGGTFTSGNATSDVSEYYIAGAALTQDENGTIVEDTNKNIVARVDGIGFTDLASAIAAASDNDTITLVQDVSEGINIEENKVITLDLAGYRVAASTESIIEGNIIINDSSKGLGEYVGTVPISVEGGKLTLNGGNIKIEDNKNGYGIYCSDGGAVEVNGGTIQSTYAPLTGNNTTGDMNFTVNGGELTAQYGPAIYMPGQGNLTITDGVLNGGISLRMGQVNISGGTIYATNGSIDSPSEFYNYSGNAWLPDALYVFNGTYDSENDEKGNSLNINITGGEFICENGQGSAVAIYDLGKVDQNSEVKISDDATLVTNASNRGAYQVLSLADIGVNTPAAGYGNNENVDKVETAISGGNFSSAVDKEYLASGINAQLYSINNSNAPYSYYSTVEDAMQVAKPGDVVVNLSAVTSETMYEVKFDNNGTVATISVPDGANLTLPAPTRNGYTFGGWRYGNTVYKAGETVKVTSDMTFTAVWSAINIPDTYDIEIADAANGEVDTSLSNASAGSTITITATPDSGYSVASVTVTGPDGRVDVVRVNATTYTFKMPAGDVTVRVTFTDSDALPFTDVSAGQWFYDAVAYVYTNGMMEGDSATTFNPDGTMTRAMFWAVLGRIDGATITGTNWADQARDWAMAEGVSDGTDPNGLVTREQMVTMLWRYAGEPESSASLSAYTDADSVSDWAETAMRWAIDEGIITGMTDTTLVPQGTATRAQCAAIFMRFDQM